MRGHATCDESDQSELTLNLTHSNTTPTDLCILARVARSG